MTEDERAALRMQMQECLKVNLDNISEFKAKVSAQFASTSTMFVNDHVLGKLFKIGVLACNARNVWRPYDKLYFAEVGAQLF